MSVRTLHWQLVCDACQETATPREDACISVEEFTQEMGWSIVRAFAGYFRHYCPTCMKAREVKDAERGN